MNFNKTNIFASAVFISSMMGAAPAIGQGINEIDELIVKGKYLYADQVNALKTPIPIIDVPQSLSIITDEDIRKRGFRELADIVRYTPGVNTSQGEGHRDSIVFRGVRSTADFYLDGVRDDVQYYRSLYNLEQVEILRGPNALLFGRGGTGGILNRVTKKGVIGEEFGSLAVGADRFGAYDAALDYNIEVGENSALRVNVHHDSLENHRDFYDGTRTGINPALKMRLTPKTTLDISYEYADHERFIDRGIPTQNGRPVRALKDITFGDATINTSDLEAHIARGILSYEISDNMKGNLTIHYGDYEKTYRNLYASGYDGTNVTLDGYLDPTTRTNLIVSANIVGEFDIAATQHTFLLGLEYIDTENKNHRYNTYWSTTMSDKETFRVTRPLDLSTNANGVATSVDFTTDLHNRTESDVTVNSLLIQDQIDLTNWLKLTLGGRFDSFDITVRDIDDASMQSRTDEKFSPRAGIIFKPQDNISLYASYSESFLPRSGEQFKTLSANNARLKPDVYENKEFGMKWDIDENLSFTANYFDSEQTQAVRDSDTGETSEIIGLKVDGVELELKGQITDYFSLAAAYSKLDGKTGTGGEAREIPDRSYSLWGEFTVTDRFNLGLGLTHQGKSNIRNNDPSLILPDYTRFDVAAYYQLAEDLIVQLNIENLTDEVYYPHAHSTHQVSVGTPFNARLSVRKTF